MEVVGHGGGGAGGRRGVMEGGLEGRGLINMGGGGGRRRVVLKG